MLASVVNIFCFRRKDTAKNTDSVHYTDSVALIIRTPLIILKHKIRFLSEYGLERDRLFLGNEKGPLHKGSATIYANQCDYLCVFLEEPVFLLKRLHFYWANTCISG